ncbi:hypothetical protein A8709_05460 [Paenibacillus pectinilyticus]|uniref:Uncharacterized protein n=1 Tax=Paenibacillus pectinilyticus TaxID=512399 RepID=A0A1C0ZSS9_9BACL|nr:hypothetical protein [Paenibacillus pectinilyticus]OCT11135.1 hypothetical protein A8709_05460 [Paenibacillus pectinilyticus]
MSDKKLDILIGEIQKVNSRLDQKENLLVQLIDIVKSTNTQTDDIKTTIQTFCSETSVNFKKLDRRVKLNESDLDNTMLQVEESRTPRN